MFKVFRSLLVLLFSMLMLYAAPAHAANPVKDGHVEVELAATQKVIVPGKPFYIGLAMIHEKGWHSYWLNPGDSGFPAKLHWTQDNALKISDIFWPTPHPVKTGPLTNYAYKDAILLPMLAEAPATMKPGQTIVMKLHVDWLMCKDICLPGKADVELPLKVGTKPEVNKTWAPLFDFLLKNDTPIGVKGWQEHALYSAENVKLSFTPPAKAFPKPTVFRFIPFTEGVINDSGEQTVSIDKHGMYTLNIPRDTFNLKTPEPLGGILIWGPTDFEHAVAIKAPTNAQALAITQQTTADANAEGPTVSFLLAVLLALLGGLVLNLMPCVLPILAIKVTHIVQHSKKRSAWQHGVAFMAGVVVAFWALASILVSVKQAGHTLGWGFQLQSPTFIMSIAMLLLLVALDLLGVYEIGTSLTRLGGKFADLQGKTGSFMTGILATIVATPCTAPFMGTAMAYTLDKHAAVTLAVFTALGLGLALPYLVLTARPQLLSFVPKPGAWMETFKQVLAFPVLATVLWLVWVLAQQAGTDGMMTLLAVLLVVTFAAWFWGRFGQSLSASGMKRLLCAVLVLLMVGAAWCYGSQQLHDAAAKYTPTLNKAEKAAGWLAFKPGLPQQLQAQGKPSLVIFTAAWCITCKVNERMVLKTPAVTKLLADKGIQVIVADWTNQDEAIASELALHGRRGVPFYLLYPPAAGQPPVALPELLTQQRVINTIETTVK